MKRSIVQKCMAVALAVVLAPPAAAELISANELARSEATTLIDDALTTVVAVVHIRLDQVSISDENSSALVYTSLARRGYLRKKDCTPAGMCTFEETVPAIRFRPAADATQVRREWIPACGGRDDCAETVWTVARYHVRDITGMTQDDKVASVEYVVEARLNEIAQVLWPTMSETVTSMQTARFERAENGWKLLSVWVGGKSDRNHD